MRSRPAKAADPYEDGISAIVDFLASKGASEGHAQTRAGEICKALREYEESAHTPPHEAREFTKRRALVSSLLTESIAFRESYVGLPSQAPMVALVKEVRRDPEGFLRDIDVAEENYRASKSAKRHIKVPRDRAFRTIIRIAAELDSKRPLNLTRLRVFIHEVVERARPVAPTFDPALSPKRLRAFAREIR